MPTILMSLFMALCMTAFEVFTGTGRDGVWVFLLGTLGSVVTLIILSLVIIGRQWRTALLGLAAAAFGAFWIVMSFAPGGDRIIARTTAVDGTQMCIVQRFTGSWGEPYQVSFYYRPPGKRWGWFYYEHEDTRWWFGSIKLTSGENRVEIRRFLTPVAYFDLPKEAFTIVRWNRTIEGGQHWMPAGWEPEQELRP